MVEPHSFHFDREGENGDEFYEKIEAPQFVDLTAPDHYLPGDDQHWFCWRVGCNQKHEDEMDSEVIYNNFVLRVMAARSPNVLRKAFYRNNSSSSSQTCPQTVPTKLSKLKVGSKLAMISSISEKLNSKFKTNHPPLQTLCPTPDTKSTNRAVAKTLVFDSPEKSAARAKTPLELTAPIKALCAGMKKLNINARKKHPSHVFLDQLTSREVKSRIFSPLIIKNPTGNRFKQVEEDEKEEDNNRSNLNSMANCIEINQTATTSQVNHESILEKHADAYDDDKENIQPGVNNLERKIVRKQLIESHKITKVMSKSSTKLVGDDEATKHRKLKLTDPKPFRLRTYERGILKEAKLDKKLHLMRDINVVADKPQNGPSKLKVLKDKEAAHKPSAASRKHEAAPQPDDDVSQRGVWESEKNTKRIKQAFTKASLKPHSSSLLGATRQARSNASQASSTSSSSTRCFPLQAKRSAPASKEPFFAAVPLPKKSCRGRKHDFDCNIGR